MPNQEPCVKTFFFNLGLRTLRRLSATIRYKPRLFDCDVRMTGYPQDETIPGGDFADDSVNRLAEDWESSLHILYLPLSRTLMLSIMDYGDVLQFPLRFSTLQMPTLLLT